MRQVISDSCGDIYDVEMINWKVLRSILNFEEEAEIIYEKLKFMINLKKVIKNYTFQNRKRFNFLN